jgi:hypothetical protein
MSNNAPHQAPELNKDQKATEVFVTKERPKEKKVKTLNEWVNEYYGENKR